MFDIGNESLIAYDISHWQKYQGERISLKRLARKLNVREFRMPEIQKNFWEKPKLGVPFMRFPRWFLDNALSACCAAVGLRMVRFQLTQRPRPCPSPRRSGRAPLQSVHGSRVHAVSSLPRSERDII